jgi:hypothetical protein
VKSAVAGGVVNTKLVNSIKEFNQFDKFINQFTKYVKNTSVASGMFINVTFGGFDAITTTNKIGNIVEMTINSAKTEVASLKIINEFTSVTAKMVDDFNNAATITIKTAPDAITQEGKIAFAKLDESNFVIATQINNKIQFNYFKLAGATPHFYQGPPQDKNDPQNKCLICPERTDNNLSSQLCANLNRLVTNTQNEAGVKKLCPITNLNAVVNELLSYTVEEQKAFINDIDSDCSNDKSLCTHISNIDVGIVKAWRMVREARCANPTTCNSPMPKDWAILNQIKNLTNNSSIYADLGEYNGIKTLVKTNERTKCNTCGNSGVDFIQPMDKYLLDLNYFASHFTAATGRSNVKSLLITSAQRSREAEYYIIEVVRNNPTLFNNITAYEYTDLKTTPKCEPDVVNNGIYCEFKSWSNIKDKTADKDDPEAASSSSGAFSYFKSSLTGNSYKQFKALLSATEVTSMNKISYYFDAKKLAGPNNEMKEEWVKTVFKDMMYDATAQTLKQQGNEVFEVIWGNNSLRENLFKDDNIDFNLDETIIKPIALSKFKEKASNTSNLFYNFIKVK